MFWIWKKFLTSKFLFEIRDRFKALSNIFNSPFCRNKWINEWFLVVDYYCKKEPSVVWQGPKHASDCSDLKTHFSKNNLLHGNREVFQWNRYDDRFFEFFVKTSNSSQLRFNFNCFFSKSQSFSSLFWIILYAVPFL